MFINRRSIIATLALGLSACPALAQRGAAEPAKPADAPSAPPAAPTTPAAPPADTKPAEVKADPSLPTGLVLQDKFIAATGGREAIQKVKARISSGSLEISAMGLKGKMQLQQQSPDKGRIQTEMDGIGKIEQGSNGEVVWEVSPVAGPRIVDGPERKEFLRSIALGSELTIATQYPSMNTVAVEKINDKDAYKVVLTSADGQSMSRWYDKESALLVKQSQTVKNQMGDIQAESFFEDYREVGAIKLPFVSRQRFMNLEQKITFDKVEQPESLPAAALELPAEIKQLLEAAKKPGTPAEGSAKPDAGETPKK